MPDTYQHNPDVSIRPLQAYRIAEVERDWPRSTPTSWIYAGLFNGLTFSVEMDTDGHVEAYLSGKSQIDPPSDSRCRAFFRHWGVKPENELPRETFKLPYIRGWVVRHRTPQAVH